MSYLIVSSWDRGAFQADVNQRLAEGWTLRGDVAVATEAGDTFYAQALTRNRPA